MKLVVESPTEEVFVKLVVELVSLRTVGLFVKLVVESLTEEVFVKLVVELVSLRGSWGGGDWGAGGNGGVACGAGVGTGGAGGAGTSGGGSCCSAGGSDGVATSFFEEDSFTEEVFVATSSCEEDSTIARVPASAWISVAMEAAEVESNGTAVEDENA